MKTLRPQKRSVSPFGSAPFVDADPLAALREAVAKTSFEEAKMLPDLIEKVSNAPANDAPQLDKLSQFLLKHRETLVAQELSGPLFQAMMDLFDRKTELFMFDQDAVLFSRERDALVGRFFAPFTETQPGLFSAFINHWVETDNPDRALHFLDFCAGSKNPTFEHYLLFTHPALARVIKNKAQMRALFEKAQPLLAKLPADCYQRFTSS